MKLNYLIAQMVTGITLLLNLPAMAQNPRDSNSPSSKIDILKQFQDGSKSQLNFGIGLQTYPINFINDVTSKPDGFCIKFANSLERKLNQDYRKNSPKKIELRVDTYEKLSNPRFDKVRKGIFDIQCSSDTKKIEDYENLNGVIFTVPFLETGAQLLLKKDKAARLKANDFTFGKIRIGVIENTTTSKLFRDMYRANVTETYEEREQYIQGLRDGKVDALAGDSILLQGILRKELHSEDYALFPPRRFLSDEPYGMVIAEPNYQFRAYVNQVIELEADKYKEYLNKEGFILEPKNYTSVNALSYWIFGLVTILMGVIFYVLRSQKMRFNTTFTRTFGGEFQLAAFVYTLRQIKYDRNIQLTIQKLEFSDQDNEEFILELEIPKEFKKEKFEKEFEKIYQRYQNSGQINLSSDDQGISEFAQLDSLLRKLIDKTDYPEFTLTINQAINNQLENARNMTNQPSGISQNMSGGTMYGGMQAAQGDGNKQAMDTNVVSSEPKQNLAEAAAEIQQLLEQLEKSYPTDTTTGKMALATEAIAQIENNPNLTARILSALKVGSVKAFEQFLSHPAASFVIGALEDWQKTKGT